MKSTDSKELSEEEIREKIIQALKHQFLTPELVEVYYNYFTYSLGGLGYSKSLHKVKYMVIGNEVLIDWKDSKWIKRIK